MFGWEYSLSKTRVFLEKSAPGFTVLLVSLHCSFTVIQYRITWQKDGNTIDYRSAQRIYRNVLDNSLTISGTIFLDTGKYTCVASNGVDDDMASATLTVQGTRKLL